MVSSQECKIIFIWYFVEYYLGLIRIGECPCIPQEGPRLNLDLINPRFLPKSCWVSCGLRLDLSLSISVFITYIARSIWAQLDSPLVCRNICLRYPRIQVGYLAGGKYCRRCEYYFFTDRLFCECCGMRLRGSPTNREYKDRVRAKKKLMAVARY